jgi:hypothetical protein
LRRSRAIRRESGRWWRRRRRGAVISIYPVNPVLWTGHGRWVFVAVFPNAIERSVTAFPNTCVPVFPNANSVPCSVTVFPNAIERSPYRHVPAGPASNALILLQIAPGNKVGQRVVDVAYANTFAGRVALFDGAGDVADAGKGVAVLGMIPIEDEAEDEAVLTLRATIIWKEREELEFRL